MKDILDYIRDSIEASKDRLKNPLLFYYILFAVLMHWKAVSLFLFSTEPIEKRIFRIERLYRGWSQGDFFWQALLMLFIVLVINIGIPYIMWLFDKLNSTPNRKRKELLYISNDAERFEDIKKSEHEFEKNKIISGSVEAEDYNNRIKSLQDSMEDSRKLHQKEIDLILKTNEEQVNSLKEAYKNAEKTTQEELKIKTNELNSFKELYEQYKINIDSKTKKELINYYNSLDYLDKKDFMEMLELLDNAKPLGRGLNDNFMSLKNDLVVYLSSHGIIESIENNQGRHLFRLTSFGENVYKLFQQLG